MALLQVVAGAVAHRLDRGLLADLARDEDERHVARAAPSAARARPGPRSPAGCSRRRPRPRARRAPRGRRLSDSTRRVCAFRPPRARCATSSSWSSSRILEMEDAKDALAGARRHAAQYAGRDRADRSQACAACSAPRVRHFAARPSTVRGLAQRLHHRPAQHLAQAPPAGRQREQRAGRARRPAAPAATAFQLNSNA